MAGNRSTHLGAAVLVFLVAGWVGFRALGDSHRPAQRTTVPVPTLPSDITAYGASDGDRSVVGPATDSSGIPAGYVHSEAGARAAAVGWVSSFGALMNLGPIAAADALRTLTTERVAESTIDRFRDERDQFIEQFGVDPSRAIWIESPLAVDVPEVTAERAVVQVWSQLIVGVGSAAAVEVLWRTQTIRLLWEDDDWRVDDVTRSEGPNPQPVAGNLPSSGTEFTRVASWTPAVLAGWSVKGH